jgi:hypothetical protein
LEKFRKNQSLLQEKYVAILLKRVSPSVSKNEWVPRLETSEPAQPGEHGHWAQRR